MFVLDCIYKFCSCVHEQWYSVILGSLKPWLDPGYSCLLASETRANATLKQSYQQTLGLRSGKLVNAPIPFWFCPKKATKHIRNLQSLGFRIPVPAPQPWPWGIYTTKARLGGRILSEGLAQLAAATWMRKNPNFPGDGGRCDRSVPGAGYTIYSIICRYTLCIYCICISYIRRYT